MGDNCNNCVPSSSGQADQNSTSGSEFIKQLIQKYGASPKSKRGVSETNTKQTDQNIARDPANNLIKKNRLSCNQKSNTDASNNVVFNFDNNPEKFEMGMTKAKLANYQLFVDLQDSSNMVPNLDEFDCSICMVKYQPHEGVVLRDCLHTFCRECLITTIQFNTEPQVKCPFRDHEYTCDSVLLEREIKALVTPEMYEQHLTRSILEAENNIQNSFHCKTPNCQGWCIIEDNVVTEFRCPVCNHNNCIECQGIHTGLNCEQYQEFVNQELETNIDAFRTNKMLQEMVANGEAMKCSTCQVILMKQLGCDWLRCSMCKTEICWVTRGPRWGPSGKGDTSGGCKCGVNGIKCHPRCSYCH